ncbi:protein sip5 [Anaeramoeba flamelloides]|uniref:Protein sip5 n=1 Tax=Anaeramoeba flamelloides TaxID=1746091 RepID=A0AAV7YD49_9EUKA|nr:protein sip5 [Anaeramoeba flamelloides]
MSTSRRKLKKYISSCCVTHTEPTYEIYDEIHWNCNFVKNQIKKKKLAPLFFPEENSTKYANFTCSICYNYFPILNKTHCCNKGICSECYLQIQPKPTTSSKDRCPFCRQNNFKIKYNFREAMPKNNKKKTNKQQEQKEKVKLARKKERELFETQIQKIKEKLLLQRETELKKGLYDQELKKLREKEKLREKNKSIFLLQKKQQEQIDQENNQIKQNQQSETQSISERIQRLMSNMENLSTEQRIQLDDLMLQQVLRLSLEQN